MPASEIKGKAASKREKGAENKSFNTFAKNEECATNVGRHKLGLVADRLKCSLRKMPHLNIFCKN